MHSMLAAHEVRFWNELLEEDERQYKRAHFRFEDSTQSAPPSAPQTVLRECDNLGKIHAYFSNFEARKCCLTLTGGSTVLSALKVPRNEEATYLRWTVPDLSTTTFKYSAPEDGILSEREFETYKRSLLCANYPILSAPDALLDCSPVPHDDHPSYSSGYYDSDAELDPHAARPPSQISGFTSMLEISGSFASQGQNEAEQSVAVLPPEALCDWLKCSFGLTELTSKAYLRKTYEPYRKKTDAKILVDELCTQLSLLENDSHPFYNLQTFRSRAAYNQWQQKQRSLIGQCINKVWQRSLPPRRATSGQPEAALHHMCYKILFIKLIGYEAHVRGPRSPGQPLVVLSSASRRLLQEFALRYAIGEVYQELVLLKVLADNFTCESGTVGQIIQVLQRLCKLFPARQANMVLVVQEFKELCGIVEQLHEQCARALSRVHRTFEEVARVRGVELMICLLKDVIATKECLRIDPKSVAKSPLSSPRAMKQFSDSPPSASFHTPSQSVDSILTELLHAYIKDNVEAEYERHKVISLSDLGCDLQAPHVSPKLMSRLIVHARDEVSVYERSFSRAYERYVDVGRLAAGVLYELLMDDLAAMCARHDAKQESRGVDLAVLSVAYRLDELDRAWRSCVGVDQQVWRARFEQQMLHWLDILTTHVTKLVLHSIATDNFAPLEVECPVEPRTEGLDNSRCTSTLSQTSLAASEFSAFSAVRSFSSLQIKPRGNFKVPVPAQDATPAEVLCEDAQAADGESEQEHQHHHHQQQQEQHQQQQQQQQEQQPHQQHARLPSSLSLTVEEPRVMSKSMSSPDLPRTLVVEHTVRNRAFSSDQINNEARTHSSNFCDNILKDRDKKSEPVNQISDIPSEHILETKGYTPTRVSDEPNSNELGVSSVESLQDQPRGLESNKPKSSESESKDPDVKAEHSPITCDIEKTETIHPGVEIKSVDTDSSVPASLQEGTGYRTGCGPPEELSQVLSDTTATNPELSLETTLSEQTRLGKDSDQADDCESAAESEASETRIAENQSDVDSDKSQQEGGAEHTFPDVEVVSYGWQSASGSFGLESSLEQSANHDLVPKDDVNTQLKIDSFKSQLPTVLGMRANHSASMPNIHAGRTKKGHKVLRKEQDIRDESSNHYARRSCPDSNINESPIERKTRRRKRLLSSPKAGQNQQTSARKIRVAKSYVELLCLVHRCEHSVREMCDTLYPLPNISLPLGSQSQTAHYKQSIMLRWRIHVQFVQLVLGSLRLYCNNLLSMDLCGEKSHVAKALAGCNLVEEIKSMYDEKKIWGCRHMKTKTSCYEFVDKKAAYLADKFEPVSKEMCCRIEHITKLEQHLCDIETHVEQSMCSEQLTKLAESLDVPLAEDLSSRFAECRQHMRLTWKTLVKVLIHRVNLFIREALPLLVQLGQVPRDSVQVRYGPLISFLFNHAHALQQWLPEVAYEMAIKKLWSRFVKNVEEVMQYLVNSRQMYIAIAENFIQLIAHILTRLCGGGLSVDYAYRQMDACLEMLHVCTLPTPALIATYNNMHSYQQEKEHGPSDNQPPWAYIERMCNDLHTQRKCFSGLDLVEWIMRHPVDNFNETIGDDSTDVASTPSTIRSAQRTPVNLEQLQVRPKQLSPPIHQPTQPTELSTAHPTTQPTTFTEQPSTSQPAAGKDAPAPVAKSSQFSMSPLSSENTESMPQNGTAAAANAPAPQSDTNPDILVTVDNASSGKQHTGSIKSSDKTETLDIGAAAVADVLEVGYNGGMRLLEGAVAEINQEMRTAVDMAQFLLNKRIIKVVDLERYSVSTSSERTGSRDDAYPTLVCLSTPNLSYQHSAASLRGLQLQGKLLTSSGSWDSADNGEERGLGWKSPVFGGGSTSRQSVPSLRTTDRPDSEPRHEQPATFTLSGAGSIESSAQHPKKTEQAKDIGPTGSADNFPSIESAPSSVDSTTSCIFQPSSAHLYCFVQIMDHVTAAAGAQMTEILSQRSGVHDSTPRSASGGTLFVPVCHRVPLRFVLNVIHNRRYRDETAKRFLESLPQERLFEYSALFQESVSAGCFSFL